MVLPTDVLNCRLIVCNFCVDHQDVLKIEHRQDIMRALGCTDSNSYGMTFIFGMVGTHGHGRQSRMITWWYQFKLAGCGSVYL